jgi:aspartyl/asparaginyl beta-hydroxylase (cupin superfamily)
MNSCMPDPEQHDADVVEAIRQLFLHTNVHERKRPFGVIEFRLGKFELGHIHRDNRADFPLSGEERRDLLSHGMVIRHHNRRPGWATRYMTSSADISAIIEIFRFQFEIAQARELLLIERAYHRSFFYRQLLHLAELLRRLTNSIFRVSSKVPNAPFIDPSLFTWTSELEGRYLEVKTELLSLLSRPGQIPSLQEISDRQVVLTQDNLWRVFFLFGYNGKIAMNCTLCPRTASILETIPDLRSAYFSILSPGKRIPPHRGPFKGLLRYQIGLIIPPDADSCGIRVGWETRHWSEGRSLIFDNTYVHSAWNETNQDRVVLIIDIERPMRSMLTAATRFALRVISLTPSVRKANTNAQIR